MITFKKINVQKVNMAGNTEVPSSANHTNFIVNNIDSESIKLLNDQAYLIYDGTRIKWEQV